MDFHRTRKYDKDFIRSNMMGPNSMMILEELVDDVPLKSGMRILDLGCGNGLTSIFLAKEYGVQVFALDLWVSATDNIRDFRRQVSKIWLSLSMLMRWICLFPVIILMR